MEGGPSLSVREVQERIVLSFDVPPLESDEELPSACFECIPRCNNFHCGIGL